MFHQEEITRKHWDLSDCTLEQVWEMDSHVRRWTGSKCDIRVVLKVKTLCAQAFKAKYPTPTHDSLVSESRFSNSTNNTREPRSCHTSGYEVYATLTMGAVETFETLVIIHHTIRASQKTVFLNINTWRYIAETAVSENMHFCDRQ
jgi:hypothetical protein